MPTVLLPSDATYIMDLHHDVSPGEVRVTGSQDVTIRVEASLRRRLQYGGVNRAFYVTDQGTLRLEGIEISDRNLTNEWIPLQSGDAIILVTGRQYAAENERNAAVYLRLQVFAQSIPSFVGCTCHSSYCAHGVLS